MEGAAEPRPSTSARISPLTHRRRGPAGSARRVEARLTQLGSAASTHGPNLHTAAGTAEAFYPPACKRGAAEMVLTLRAFEI